jgi:hypothetical protein
MFQKMSVFVLVMRKFLTYGFAKVVAWYLIGYQSWACFDMQTRY